MVKKQANQKVIRKLKSFSIGRGKGKIDIKNVKKIYKKGVKQSYSKISTYYSVDVYHDNKLKHKDLLIMSDNKTKLRTGLDLIFPRAVRRNVM